MTEPITSLPAAVAALGALPMPAGPVRLTPEREAEIAERTPKRAAALTAWIDKFSPLAENQRAVENAETVLEEDVPALLAELAAVRKERDEAQAALKQIRFLHKDSPMGPCPVCVDDEAMARGDDPTVPYPCPTARLAGAKDCDPPSFRNATERGEDR